MSFFKSNKTNTTAATTETTATEETTSNGSLLKTLAIAGGTAIGIGAAIFGGRKVYKHFHSDEEIIDSDDDFEEEGFDEDDDFNEVPVNETPVESFNEVETEVTENNETTEVEETKVEETVNPETVKAEEAKTEETKKSCWDAFKDPKEAAPAEADEATVEEPVKKAPVEDTTTKTEETNKPEPKETVTMKFERMLGEAVSRIPYDKPESVDLAFYIRCVGGYLREIDMDEAGNTGKFVIAEQCLAMTNLVSRAIIHIASTNITDLDEYRGVYVDIKRLQREFKASKIMDFTQKPELCKEKFEETLNMVAQNLKLTKKILKLQEANTTDSKISAGEIKTAEPVVDEKQATTKESPSETQIGNSTVIRDDGETVTLKASVSEESVQNVKDVIDIVSKIPNREDPEKNDMPYYIRVIGGRIAGITEPEATFLAYDASTKTNKFMDACVDVCDMTGKAICNLANSGKNPLASMQWIDRCTNELVASGIIDNTYDPNTYRAAILKAHKESMDVLSKLVSGETKTDTNDNVIDKINTILGEINPMVTNDFDGVTSEKFIEKIRAIDELIGRLDKSKRSKSMIKVANSNINIAVRMFCDDKRDAINECDDSNKIEELAADVSYVTTLKLSNIVLTNTTLIAINKAIAASQNKADEIMAKNESQDLVKASDETQADDNSSNETQVEEPLTYTMSEKIQEVVQQSDETAATKEPETESQAPMSPEASSLAAKLQEVGELMRAKKWSDASEFYKTQLTQYLADDGLSNELREEIMSIKTKATNMMMSQKQLEAKQKAVSAKASKKGGKKRRRH